MNGESSRRPCAFLVAIIYCYVTHSIHALFSYIAEVIISACSPAFVAHCCPHQRAFSSDRGWPKRKEDDHDRPREFVSPRAAAGRDSPLTTTAPPNFLAKDAIVARAHLQGASWPRPKACHRRPEERLADSSGRWLRQPNLALSAGCWRPPPKIPMSLTELSRILHGDTQHTKRRRGRSSGGPRAGRESHFKLVCARR